MLELETFSIEVCSHDGRYWYMSFFPCKMQIKKGLGNDKNTFLHVHMFNVHIL